MSWGRVGVCDRSRAWKHGGAGGPWRKYGAMRMSYGVIELWDGRVVPRENCGAG